MPLIRSLPENATLKDLRAAEPDLFALLQPYGEQLMRAARDRQDAPCDETGFG